jgi:hypothetical protein
MRNTADMEGDKPTAVRSQSISDVSAVNPLAAEGRGAIFFSVPDITKDLLLRDYFFGP